MSFLFLSAPDMALTGAPQMGLGGAGELDLAAGTITLRKTSAPVLAPKAAARKPAPVTAAARNPAAQKFLTPSDILAVGAKRWIRSHRAAARRPGLYRETLKPQAPVYRAKQDYAALKNPPAPAPASVTLSIKQLPTRPLLRVAMRAAGLSPV